MTLTVAALQLAFTEDTDANIRAVSELVREAAAKGAEVVLPPELFEGPYFCRVEDALVLWREGLGTD
jgi:N-carbamoylputrescine amidase